MLQFIVLQRFGDAFLTEVAAIPTFACTLQLQFLRISFHGSWERRVAGLQQYDVMHDICARSMAERLLALMTMQMYAVTLVRVFSKLFAIFLVSARRTFRWIENDHQLLSEKALEQFIYEVLELLMDGVCGSNG